MLTGWTSAIRRVSRNLSLRIPIAALALGCLHSQSAQGALVAYWPFDEGTGLTAGDQSGYTNANNGTLQGGNETPAWVPGRFGTALGFTWQQPNTPGAGKRVVVPYHHELLLNGPFTISFWYRMDAATPSGTFPGIMRIGSQSATTGTTIGWGYFRTANLVHKRGNAQPGVYPAINVGQWYHVALRFDGTTAANNNIAYINGVATTFSQNWLTNTATNTVFELGRMDAFDQATLDDLALYWNEALAPARIRSLYTVPTSLPIAYSLGDMKQLWAIYDGGPGSTAVVKGTTWSYAGTLPGSLTDGDAYIVGGTMYVALGGGKGVSAPLNILSGTVSPAGIGTPGTFPLVGVPAITVTNASVLFDLSENTVVGSQTNDLISITGDLEGGNSRVVVDPIGQYLAGTYTLFTYTGTKNGSLTLSNNTRYNLALDETTAGQVNLTASGTNAQLTWTSTSSGVWDLATSNWLNTGTSATDKFYQGDDVVFDGATAVQTNITINTPLFPRSIVVNQTNRSFVFSGAEQLGGVAGGITVNGTGIMTLSTPNTFLGPVTVNGGTLKIGSAAALGSTNGETIVQSGATLDLAGINPGTENVTVGGAGVNGLGAIYNSGAALVNTGLRGRVRLTADTTLGGVNRWDMFGGALEGNGYKLTKVGAPEIALSNLGSTGLGDIDIRAGALTILGSTSMGDPSKVCTVATNAILSFWQIAPNVLNKPVIMTSAIMRNATSGGTDVATNLGDVTITGDATIQATANIALMGVVSGTGNIVKQNTGTLYLGGNNLYTGTTTISAGRLALVASGNIATSPRINLQSGSTFDVSQLGGGYSVGALQTLVGSGTIAGSLTIPTGATVLPGVENVPATLTVTNELALSGGTLVFDLSAAPTEGAGVNDLINVGGNLTLSGVTAIIINPLGLLSVGNTYTLINYAGTLSGTAALNLNIINNTHYTFALSAAGGKVTLQVTGGAAGQLFWLGGTPGAESLWDIQLTPNWSDTLGAAATFFGGDVVTFDDFGDPTTVTLVGNLTPASIRMENGSADYTFQGTGKLSGNSSLTKLFGATVTIGNSNVNDYVGPTDIEGGTVRVGTGGTVGNLGSGPITNNATLAYNRSDTITFNNSLFGSGNLVKEGGNTMVFSANNAGYNGTITATGGVVRPTITNGLGNGAGPTVIGGNATLDVNGVNLGAEPVAVSGSGAGGAGAIINAGAGQNNAIRFLTLNGNTTVGAANRWDVRADPTASLSTGGNGYSLTKVGANQFSLVDVAVDPALGDINVNAGTFSAELSSGAGNPTNTITVASNAVLQFFNRSVIWDKVHVLNGGQNIFNNSGSTVMNGPITLNAPSSSPITFNVGGSALTVNSPVGGIGALTKTGTGSLLMGSDNTYPGTTTISAGALYLGFGTNAGSFSGAIVNNGILGIYRGDFFTLTNAYSGSGSLEIRSANGVALSPVTFNVPGSISVGRTNAGRLIIPAGLTGTWGNLFLGDSPAVPGEVWQLGGNVTITTQFRAGHWPNNTSTYIMGGGNLTLTAAPGAVVNQTGAAEQNGILYLGVDGTGIFTQTGGVASAHGIVLDARGNTAGTDTFALEGGRFNVGPSGIKSGSLDANTSYAIFLGGGTLASSATWTSVLAMTLTGTNGNTTFDTVANTNTLTGALTGAGGLTKAGAGTLILAGADGYAGGTVVSQGVLVVRGTLGAGTGGTAMVAGGTLTGDGLINDTLSVSNGTVAPGLGIGRLTVNNVVNLGANIAMEISKTAGGLTNDLLTASTLNYGGTLTVTASGLALSAGDTFKLFDATTYNAGFASLALPALTGNLSWDTSRLAVDGTIRVTQPQPRISLSFGGGTLSLSWSNATDFTLQAQTNTLGVGIQSSNWVTIATGTNAFNTPVDTNNGSVFYRLIK